MMAATSKLRIRLLPTHNHMTERSERPRRRVGIQIPSRAILFVGRFLKLLRALNHDDQWLDVVDHKA